MLLGDGHAEGKIVARKTWESATIPNSACVPLSMEKDCAGAFGALIDGLHNLDWQVRIRAVVALGQTGSTEALRLLEECSRQDRHKEVRRTAAKILGEMGNASGRSAAAEALGHIGGTNTTAALVRLSKDPDFGVRVSAAVALGDVGTADAEGALKELLKDGDIRVGIAAAKALAKSE